MLTVFVNNQTITLQAAANLTQALEASGVTSYRGIAVALNNAVVPRAEWSARTLNQNDKITVIKATQGG